MGILDDLAAQHGGGQAAAAGGILDQLAAKHGGGAPAASRKLTTTAEVLKGETDKMSGTEKFFAGVGGGMVNFVHGLKQLGAEAGNKVGLVKKETVNRLNQQGLEDRNMLNSLKSGESWHGPAHVGQFVGETAPLMTLPGGVAGGALKRAGTAALTGAGIGAAQFVAPGESRTQNALLGAVGGAAGSGAISGGGKLVNGLLKKVPTNAVQNLADKFKIPVTLGERTGNPATQKTEVLLERAPGFLGLKNYRRKQNEAAHGAAKNLLGKYIADPLAGDIETGNREFAGKMFEEVKSLVKDVPNQEIKPTETKAIAKELTARYPDLFKKLQDTKTEGLINDIVSGVKPVQTPASTVLGADGLPAVAASTKPRVLTFDEAWTLRQGLGEKIGQARLLLQRGEVDKTAYSQLKRLFGAVSTDLDNWSTQIGKPEIMQKFKAANGAYKNYVVKYDIIQRAYAKAAGEVGAGEMFSPKKFSTELKSIVYKDRALKNFDPIEQREMTGLANILQVVKRAGQYAENQSNGNRWGALTVGGIVESAAFKAGGAAGALKTAGAGAATAGILRFMTTTENGKRLALAASKVEPTSPAMAKIMEQIYNQAPKFLAKAAPGAGNPAPPEPAPPEKEEPVIDVTAPSRPWKTIGTDDE